MFEKIRGKLNIAVIALMMMGGNTTAENISEAFELITALVDEVVGMGSSLLNMVIIFGVIALVTALFGIIAKFVADNLSNAVNIGKYKR